MAVGLLSPDWKRPEKRAPLRMPSNDLLLYFVYVFTTIFVIVNPIEATLVYVGLTSSLSPSERRRICRRSTLVAFAVAMLFSLAGDALLRLFGITVDSLRVAGGVLLFLVAIDMLRGVHQEKKVTQAELRDANQRDDVSIFPLAIPLLTGPGAITTVVVLMGAAVSYAEKALVHAHFDIAAAVRSSDVQVTFIKDGDHRLSRPADIDLLLATVAGLLESH